MTRISIYSKDVNVTGNDRWIGSDAQNQNRTKNFTPDNVATYFNENQVIDLGVELRYFYDTLDPLQERVFGSITFETEIGPQVNFSAISTFILSKYTMGHTDVSQFLDFLIGSNVLLSRSNNINMFGYYKIDNIEPYLPDPNFFVVTLTFDSGNGYMKEDEDYFISLVQFEQTIPEVPTKTSDLINDGEDGVHPFITAEDVTTPTLQSVTDEGNTTTNDVVVDSALYESIISNNYISTNTKGAPTGVGLLSSGVISFGNGSAYSYLSSNAANLNVYFNLPNKASGTYTLATTSDIPSVTGFVPYTGATQDVDLGEFEIKAGQVEFDQTPTGTAGVGIMQWNDADGTVNLGLKGGNVTLQIGQEQVLRVVNKTATNVNLLEANYQAVRVTGAQGQRLKVDLAQATNDTLSAETIGLVTETINNNQEGFITTSGLVRGINTTGSLQGETWADGDILYLSPTTAGNATKVKPTAPNHLIILGYVIHAHINQGSIFVKVDNGYEISELHDVKITSAANNNVLAYTSATDIWENKTVETALGYTPFQLPALTSGSVLFSDGTTIAQDNSQFFWDNTNKRLCLGTNTSVTGSALSISSAAQSNIQLIDTTNNASLNLGVGNFDATISSNGRLFLQSSTTLSVGTTNVGIGISSATLAKFHVVGNVLFSAGNVSLNSTSGNTQIGTSTDGGFKLDVNGTARVSGTTTITPAALTGTAATSALDIAQTWNTTGTPSAIKLNVTDTSSNGSSFLLDLRVANTQLFAVTKSGFIAFGGAFGSTGALIGTSAGTLNFYHKNTTAAAYGFDFRPNSGAITATSSESGLISLRQTFSPTSGTGIFNAINLSSNLIINQTGTATGITRGLYINPTLTAAADFRAIETTAGNVLFGASGTGFFWDNTNNRLGIGTATPTTSLHIVGTNELLTIGDGLNTSSSFCAFNGRAYFGFRASVGATISTGASRSLSFGTGTFASFTEWARFAPTTGNFLLNTTTDAGFKLDVNGTARVKAQSALSTEVTFSVRNSANTRNFLVVNGAGDVYNNGAGGVTSNTFFGENAGRVATGQSNTFFGNNAGASNTGGNFNSFFGLSAGSANIGGLSNCFFGRISGFNNTNGSNNSFFGTQSGRFIADGITNLTAVDNSVFIGFDTRANGNSQTNQIVIGDTAIGAGSNTATLGNTSIVDTILRGRINLQQYATGSRPTYVKGALIYDSTLGKLVVGGDAGWEVVTSI